jgi:hypothetical protein
MGMSIWWKKGTGNIFDSAEKSHGRIFSRIGIHPRPHLDAGFHRHDELFKSRTLHPFAIGASMLIPRNFGITFSANSLKPLLHYQVSSLLSLLFSVIPAHAGIQALLL